KCPCPKAALRTHGSPPGAPPTAQDASRRAQYPTAGAARSRRAGSRRAERPCTSPTNATGSQRRRTDTHHRGQDQRSPHGQHTGPDHRAYRKEVTWLETTKPISNITQDVPYSFNDNEYLSIVSALKLILDDFKYNYYHNSSISGQENELLSELANLAGQIYAMGKTTYKEELKDWKTFIEEDRLPEVRRYSDLFE